MKAGWLKNTSTLVPYVAVLIGLYVFKNAWLAIGLYHFGITMFLITGDRKALLKKVLIGWNPIIAAPEILMSVMVIPIVFFLWPQMELQNVPLREAMGNLGLSNCSWIFFMIYFSTVQPLLEELYWRGYLESNRKHLSWIDLAFAGYHVLVLACFVKAPWLILVFIAVAIAGCTWRQTTARTRGLATVLLSHVAADISIIAVVYILIR